VLQPLDLLRLARILLPGSIQGRCRALLARTQLGVLLPA